MEAIRGPNNTFSFRWKCNKCESGKIIKSHSGSPTSNLKSHVSKFHLESISSFLTLRDCNKINSSSNTIYSGNLNKCEKFFLKIARFYFISYPEGFICPSVVTKVIPICELTKAWVN